jgi:hypothetical protein
VLSLPLLIIAISYTLAHEALASSPSFPLQQLLDSSFDWIDMAGGNMSREGYNFTDIQSINYLNDGKFLNATLWLHSLKGLSSFYGHPSSVI